MESSLSRQEADQPPTLSTLPEELLAYTSTFLDGADLIPLRQVSRKMERISADSFGAKFFRTRKFLCLGSKISSFISILEKAPHLARHVESLRLSFPHAHELRQYLEEWNDDIPPTRREKKEFIDRLATHTIEEEKFIPVPAMLSLLPNLRNLVLENLNSVNFYTTFSPLSLRKALLASGAKVRQIDFHSCLLSSGHVDLLLSAFGPSIKDIAIDCSTDCWLSTWCRLLLANLNSLSITMGKMRNDERSHGLFPQQRMDKWFRTPKGLQHYVIHGYNTRLHGDVAVREGLKFLIRRNLGTRGEFERLERCFERGWEGLGGKMENVQIGRGREVWE